LCQPAHNVACRYSLYFKFFGDVSIWGDFSNSKNRRNLHSCILLSPHSLHFGETLAIARTGEIYTVVYFYHLIPYILGACDDRVACLLTDVSTFKVSFALYSNFLVMAVIHKTTKKLLLCVM
jgi:hypothetical protein